MKRILFLFVLLWVSARLHSQSAAEVYVTKFDSLAVEVMHQYGIPASLILGLALQESAAGQSKLCVQKHNHFGMKTVVHSAKTRSGHRTVYRTFDSDEDSYLRFGEMMESRKYYPDLKGNMDYMKWLKAMKAAHYAASSKWITYVSRIIKRYDLTRFDELEIPAIEGAAMDSTSIKH